MSEPITTAAPADSPLFSETAVVESHTAPVIVVGLPRSGSSFLSHVLSALPEWYVFDDMYMYQQVGVIGNEGPLSDDEVVDLLKYLGWSVRARIEYEDAFFKPDCTWEDVDRMVTAVAKSLEGKNVKWPVLLEEWLTRLARHHGRSRWGYKTPQDFLHMHNLAAAIEGVRFVFIMRDPRRMMASLKYVREADGDPRQFHPIAYAYYWRMAWRALQDYEANGTAPMQVVRFEELVKDPDGIARSLGEFLGTPFEGAVEVHGHNTSFGGGQRKDLSPTEIWICERIAGSEMRAAGYEPGQGKFRLRDLPAFALISLRFAAYQVARVWQRKDARVSIVSYLRRLVGAG